MRSLASLALLALAPGALAQSNIDPTHKFSWQENTGWMNWRDAGSPAGSQGVRAHTTFFSGFAWGENIGFVNFGDGTPVNGSAYANTSGADHGVNILPNGDLAGFAWGENTGWINFSTAALAGQRARLDPGAFRLRGFAWAENLGWLNLDDAAAFVGVPGACYANCDGSTSLPLLNVNDFVCFSNRFAAGDPYANCDGSTSEPTLNVNDFVCFQTAFAAGCP
jgi:hypothetical protein